MKPWLLTLTALLAFATTFSLFAYAEKDGNTASETANANAVDARDSDAGANPSVATSNEQESASKPVLIREHGTAPNDEVGTQGDAGTDPAQQRAVPAAEAPGAANGVPDEANGVPDEAEHALGDTDASALTVFSPHLESYGYWVDDGDYGTVWVPYGTAVGADFAPYVSRGHWAFTPDGQWLWVSDYPFGFIVFHYGRWVWTSRWGWSWIPGRRYAPAWVVFRTSVYDDPYIGWAPLPPRYVWRYGHVVWLSSPPPVPYVFCSTRRVFRRSLERHVLRHRSRTRRLAERSRPYQPSPAVVGRYQRYQSPPLEVARIPTAARPKRATRPRLFSGSTSVGSETNRSTAPKELKRRLDPRGNATFESKPHRRPQPQGTVEKKADGYRVVPRPGKKRTSKTSEVRQRGQSANPKRKTKRRRPASPSKPKFRTVPRKSKQAKSGKSKATFKKRASKKSKKLNRKRRKKKR